MPASISITPTNVVPGFTGQNQNAQGPLASLYQKTGLNTIYNYPSDLGSGTKNHYVKFWVKQIVPQQSTVSTVTGANVTDKIGGQTLLGVNIQPQTYQPRAAISLYMPDTLNASYSASYDELSLTNEIGGGLRGIQGISEFASGKLSNTGSAYASDAAIQTLKSKITGFAGGALGGNEQSLSDVNLQGNGYAINPQLQMLYRGIGFRQFQLTFTFTPASSAEAQIVNDIIGTFKYHFAPDLLLGSASDSGMFLVPPSFFNIEFMINSQENPFLPKYGDCVLSDIDVNYAPNGFAAHVDGAPVQTQLNLTFKEIEIVTKAKLQAGFNNTSYSGSGSTGGLR